MTAPPYSKIRLQRSAVAGQRPATTAAADLGEVSVNLNDRKLFMRDSAGAAVTVADRITAHSATRPYEAGDITVYENSLWQAPAAIPAGAWNSALWTPLGANAESDPILKVPAGAATNTINLTGRATRKGLVIDGDPAQTANLLEIPGTAANDTRSAIIDPLGFPNERFGPSIFRVVQATHGFAFVGQPIAYSGGRWVKAQANNVLTRCVAVIEQVLDANTFVLRTGGRITQLQTNAFAGGIIVPETIYYVSDSVAGQLTTVVSAIRPDPVLYTTGATTALVMIGYSGGAGFVQRTGDTMTGNLTLAGTNRLAFDSVDTALLKGAGTPSLYAYIGGTLSARIDEPDNLAVYNETLMTRLKADARFLRSGQAVTIGGDATVNGALTTTGAASVGGGLTVTGAATVGGVLRVNAGSATVPAIVLNSNNDGLSWASGDGGYFFENNVVVAHVESATVPTQVKSVITREMGDTRYIQETERSQLRGEVFDLVYPVGSIYVSLVNAAPAWGTWAAYAQGRALVGVGTADNETWTVGQTKGTAKVQLTEAQMPSHAHWVAGNTDPNGNHAHSINDPGHQHSVNSRAGINQGQTEAEPFEGENRAGSVTSWNTTGITVNANGSHAHGFGVASDNRGGSDWHPNIQPSIGVYMFRRTA